MIETGESSTTSGVQSQQWLTAEKLKDIWTGDFGSEEKREWQQKLMPDVQIIKSTTKVPQNIISSYLNSNRLETSASNGAEPTTPRHSIGSDLRSEQLAFEHEAAQSTNHARARHN